MEQNYEWVEFLPEGWRKLASEMIAECEKIDPNYTIHDLKEKWGRICVYSTTHDNRIRAIEQEYEEKSAKICCSCGKPAVKYSTGWILPWCNQCGNEDDKFYKYF